ncbi:thioredoxin family protein [Actinomadura rupiterrae]|uniref:thioredoxin family protein n=1 Tax=Actinomadura rupiterrae TaxID=559627 RepID=UPI0020A2D411|nr:thioredoxin family protein [Actinomadura rupiterrae]MCP2336808.1 thioredoxin [Actinomadura rupiterrae]
MSEQSNSEYDERLWNRGDVVLRFPADRSVGEVQIVAVGDEDEDVEIRDARGEVTVPAGHMVSLEMPDDSPAGDLAFLDDLPADALAGFAASGVNAAGLARLAKQKELFQVVLEEPEPDDHALAGLAGLSELEILGIEDDRSPGTWFERFGGSGLMNLEVSRPRTDTDALGGIGAIDALYSLRLLSDELDGVGLEALGALDGLESLTIWTDSTLEPSHFTFAADMPELDVLEVKSADGGDLLMPDQMLELLRMLPDVEINGLWYTAEKLPSLTARDIAHVGDQDVIAIENVDDFDRLVARAGDTAVLAYFTAKWCGPCKQFGPIVERFAADNADRVMTARIDIDAAPELAERYEIQGVPTLLVIVQGEVVADHGGSLPRRDLEHFVKNALDG